MSDGKKRFGGKLNHEVPHWVDLRESLFHIRIRSMHDSLTIAEKPARLLNSALFYTEKQKWFCELMLIMPDHLHALIHFHDDSKRSKSQLIGDWKRF